MHGKPDPEMYLLALRERGLCPEECAVVEDSRNGCVSGITAGCHNSLPFPTSVPLPQDGGGWLRGRARYAVRFDGGGQGRALDNCGVETSNFHVCLKQRGPAMVGPLLLKRRFGILADVL